MGEGHAKRIPTELEIKVLQYIAGEDEEDHSRWLDLVNCALVCKAWTEYARSHMYYAIDMNILRGNIQFERLREYTHLRPFLREFTWPQMNVVGPLYHYDATSADVIKDIAPTVTKLIFRKIDHRQLDPRFQEAISTFTNLNELDMMGSIFENWTAVVRVISSSPFIATLALPSIPTPHHDNGPDGPEISYPPHPSHLVHIILAPGCSTEAVDWICRESPIPNIQAVEAQSEVDSKALAKLLRSIGGSLQHLMIHMSPNRAFLALGSCRQNLFSSITIVGGNISEVSPSCYRLTENTALESIQIVGAWESTYSDAYRSIIANMFESISSPRLWTVSLNFRSVAGEVEHFPWNVVNGLAKGSPYVLRRVEIALLLLVWNPQWGMSLLDIDGYGSYLRQVHSALPDLHKILTIGVAVRHSSYLLANLTSLCSARSMKDFHDAEVCDTNGIE